MRKPIDLNRILQVSMMVALPLALAACAPDDGDDMDTLEDSVPAVTTEDVTAEPVTVDINSVDSEVDGEATVSRAGESLMVSLTLTELAGEGPFVGQIVAGRCEDREDTVANRTDAPATTPGTNPPAAGTTPQTPAPGTTPTTDNPNQGQVLARLEAIQLTGATGGTTPPAGGAAAAPGQSGMSHSTIPVSDLRSMPDAFIEVQGTGSRTIACGNIGELDRLLTGTTGTVVAPVTPAPAPGTRP
jgi:hypothetical protein